MGIIGWAKGWFPEAADPMRVSEFLTCLMDEDERRMVAEPLEKVLEQAILSA